jgi:hypothetical protein
MWGEPMLGIRLAERRISDLEKAIRPWLPILYSTVPREGWYIPNSDMDVVHYEHGFDKKIINDVS